MAEAVQAQNPSEDKRCTVDGCERPVRSRGLCRAHYGRLLKHGNPEAPLNVAPKGAPQAFLDALPTEGDGCVIWPFAHDRKGYGLIRPIGRGTRQVHRIVCERVNGPPPTPEHQAAHSCGKGHLGCVAPWHLTWKTRMENQGDRLIHGTHSRGERSGTAKITETQVREIRALAGTATLAAIGGRYGIDPSNVSMIIRGETWAHCP